MRGVRPNSPITTTSVLSSRPRSLEIVEQRGERLIETRQAPAHAIGAVAEGVAHAHFAAVHVPAGAGRAAASLARSGAGPAVDGDEADARFDQPAGQQQVLPQGMQAVTVADGRGFSRSTSNACRPSGAVRPGRRPGGANPAIRGVAGSVAGPLQAIQQPAASCMRSGSPLRAELSGALKAGHGGMVVGRADEQRHVASAEVAAVPMFGAQKTGIADALDQPDIGGDVALAGPDLGQDGAEVRRVGGAPAWPLSRWCMASKWLLMLPTCVIERIRQMSPAILARRVCNSLMRMPGTVVAVGL